MNRDKFHSIVVAILLILLGIGLIIVEPASAYERIRQGQSVYINSTYDISGVAAGYESLVWCGGYSDWLAPDNSSVIYELPLPATKEEFYKFYIDPNIFGGRPGYWYHWNGQYESNANMRAFKVVPASKHYWYWTEGNVTNVTYETTITYENETAFIIPPPVPIRHVSDFLIARGDSWNMTWNNTAKLWVFGYYNAASMGLYDFPNVNGTFTLDRNITQNFAQGNYKMVIQEYGNKSQNFNARYDPVKDQIEYFNPEIFQVLHIDLKPLGLNQEVRLQKFREIWEYTMDNWTEFNLIVQNPSIEITELEQQEWTENQTFIHMLGYTNARNGTVLTFILDKEKQTPRTIKYSTFTTTAQGTGLGDLRWFEIAVPLIWENTYVGEHSVTANTSVGGEIRYDYHIWQAPANSYVPPKTVKYIGRDEYIPPVIQTVTIVLPTPTPEVIIQKVTVPVTPSNEQVHAEQEKVQWEFWTKVAVWGFELIIGIAIVGYAYLVWRRLK